MSTDGPARTEDLVGVLPDYRRWLYAVAYDLLPDGSPDVDDLAQEGHVAMWRAIEAWDPDRGSLPSWLTGAARLRMRAIAHSKGQWTGRPETRGSASVRPVASVDAVEDELDALTAGYDVAEAVVMAYHHGEIAAALDALTPAQRRYVLARFWAGVDPASRSPGTRRIAALIPELSRPGLWAGTRAVLAERLAHLAPSSGVLR